jgi:hypothetical protein
MTRYTLDYSTDNRPPYRRASYLRRQRSQLRTLLLLTVVVVSSLIINQFRLHTENGLLAQKHWQAQAQYDSLLRQLPAHVANTAPIVP